MGTVKQISILFDSTCTPSGEAMLRGSTRSGRWDGIDQDSRAPPGSAASTSARGRAYASSAAGSQLALHPLRPRRSAAGAKWEGSVRHSLASRYPRPDHGANDHSRCQRGASDESIEQTGGARPLLHNKSLLRRIRRACPARVHGGAQQNDQPTRCHAPSAATISHHRFSKWIRS